MEKKSGVKTSEFYITLLTLVIAVLIHLGVLSPEQGQQVTESGSSVISELFGLLTVSAAPVAYILGRSYLKKE